MSEHKKLSIQEMNRLTTEAFHTARKLPFAVVLDNVRSRHNVGAVFRTADAFRMERVYLCGITGCPPDPEIHKTALGAELSMDWSYHKDTMDAVRLLHEAGYRVYAIEQAEGSVTLEEFMGYGLRGTGYGVQVTGYGGQVTGKGIAVILGHEVFGVQQAVIDACDGCIEIPQYGTKHSLNVSVTAGIVLYTIATKLISTNPDL